MAHLPAADASPPPPELARARLQGKRAALIVVIGVALVFIGWSAAEIIPAVFGVGVHPLPPGPPGSSERVCAEGVLRLERSLERPAQPEAFGMCAPLPAEWQEAPAVEQACRRSPHGEDAWAALLRLRSAQEQLGDRARGELDPLRRDVVAHLPADLR